jgi:hypothetical protein
LDYWLEKAAEYLPDLEDLITGEQTLPGPMALWIDLHYELVKAYDAPSPNENLIRGIYDFAAWCLAQPRTSDVSTDLSTAVAVAFIEHLPLEPKFPRICIVGCLRNRSRDLKLYFAIIFPTKNIKNLSGTS